jgi:hypothetical protein
MRRRCWSICVSRCWRWSEVRHDIKYVLLSIALVLRSDEAGGGGESHDSSSETHLEYRYIGSRSFQKLKVCTE